MKNIFMKYNRHIAILLGIALIVPILFYSVSGLGTKPVEEDKSEEARIAAEISNMTGVNVEEIIKLRNEKKSWNQIMEILKAEEGSNIQSEKDKRNKLIMEMGLGEEIIKKLGNEFSDEEILEAKLLAERLIFQLEEIVEKNEYTVEKPTADIDIRSSEEDMDDYGKLLEKFELEKAVYLILKLEKEFGSKEAVLDEYLLTLQFEMDLELYIQNKEQYVKEKEEKSIGIIQEQIITLMKIEEKMLEKIQQQNVDSGQTQNLKEESDLKEERNSNGDPSIEWPLPETPDVKPANPIDDIMKEINIVDPNRNQ